MLKAGGDSKRKELIKQMEDLTLADRAKMTDEEEIKGKYGDYMQAENLLAQKRSKKQ